MSKRLIPGIFLILLIPCISAGFAQSKKAYELIYQDIQRLKQQILQIENKLEQSREDIEIIKNQLNELLTLSRRLQSEQASFKEEQKQIPTQFQILSEKLNAINLQFIKFFEELIEIKRTSLSADPQTELDETSKGEQTRPLEKKEETKEQKKEETEDPSEEEPQSQESANLSPQEVYNMAYSDYLKGNFQLAIDGFKIYLEQFPESPVVDNAFYWIGECYFSQKEYEEAIKQFTELILNYPEGDKIPAAYLKKGISLMELEKKEEALSVFKLLISKYPFEEETKIAQEKIKELGVQNERHK